MENSILYIVCGLLGGVGAWLISRYAFRLGLMDVPNERSSHEIAMPIPKGGGIGILVAFVFACLWLGVPMSFWLSASLLALLSLFGDRVDISPRFRLAVQFVAAFALLWSVLFSESSSGFCGMSWKLSPLTLALCCLPLSFFIVGTANFYNFMDGINGIAGMTGAIGFGLLGLYAFRSGGDSSAVTLAVCMSLACLAFLPFNIPKARVFMGDVGSILLGFVFAGMVVWLAKSFLDFVCMAAFLFPFYADELSTMVIRLKNPSPEEINLGRMGMLVRPHRRHVYQLLANELKVAHWKVSAGYGVLQVAVGLGALAVSAYGMGVFSAYLAMCAACFWVFSARVRARVIELVAPGLEEDPVSMEGQWQRAPQVTRQQEIRDIVGSGRGRARENQKIRG